MGELVKPEGIGKQDGTCQSRNHKRAARELCPPFIYATLSIKSEAEGSRDNSYETWFADSGQAREVIDSG